MSYICPKCGKEYSYGRMIYHKCKENEFFHGILFEKDKKKYVWNWSSASSSDELLEDEYKIMLCLINCLDINFDKFSSKINFIEKGKLKKLWDNFKEEFFCLNYPQKIV